MFFSKMVLQRFDNNFLDHYGLGDCLDVSDIFVGFSIHNRKKYLDILEAQERIPRWRVLFQ